MSDTGKYGGWDAEVLYRRYRALCAPPMVKIASFEACDVWSYSGPPKKLSLSVIVCIGPRSLLVAYPPLLHELEDHLRKAHAWLDEGDDAPYPEGITNFRFAACEDPAGRVRVRRFLRGDWAHLPDNAPLPPMDPPRPGVMH